MLDWLTIDVSAPFGLGMLQIDNVLLVYMFKLLDSALLLKNLETFLPLSCKSARDHFLDAKFIFKTELERSKKKVCLTKSPFFGYFKFRI